MLERAPTGALSALGRLPCYPDELRALVVERPLVEPSVTGLDLQARDVDQAFPLRLRHPPDRDRAARGELDVDAVVAGRVADRVRDRRLLLRPVEARGNLVVEAERVPREASTRREVRRYALEDAPLVVPCRAGGGGSETGSRRETPAPRARSSRMSPSRRSRSAPVCSARTRAWASMAGVTSMPITRRPVSSATGTATRPLPTASSTIGPSGASRASST